MWFDSKQPSRGTTKILTEVAFPPFLTAELTVLPTPFHVCNFSSDTCGWSNDHNSWKYRWKLTSEERDIQLYGQSLCLSAKPMNNNPDGSPASHWFDNPYGEDEDEQKTDGPIQSRLWSPPIRKKLRLGCIQFTYSFSTYSAAPEDVKAFSLALLRREEG
ncbi:unnamed protein product [Echinostoma caproni]|uniref:MAM domain-containing protein n=1 Tax=Echinostoma caproni TaxID=27848 RepID=A0A183AXH2_9TREM|nr:unnamed protein product [Echinostoma caproni]